MTAGNSMAASLIQKRELNANSGVPLYYQLMVIIKRYVMSGTLKPGDLLPTEMQLCRELGISRTTVRQAFSALEAEGLVVRHQGKGTFVSEPKYKRSLNTLYSFSAEMKKLGYDPQSQTLSFEIVLPPEDIKRQLKLQDGENTYKLVRLRKAGGEPLMLETVYVPVRLCPDLTKEYLDYHSLYEKLGEATGHRPVMATETYEAAILDKNEAEILGSKAGNCAFFVQRISKNEAGDLFEVAIMLVRGDRCKYEVELKRDNVSFLSRFDED